MTRRRIYFPTKDGKYTISPELNGDREELELVGSLDTCDLTWKEMVEMLSGIKDTYHFFLAIHDIVTSYHSHTEKPLIGVRMQRVNTPEEVPEADEVYFISTDGIVTLDVSRSTNA